MNFDLKFDEEFMEEKLGIFFMNKFWFKFSLVLFFLEIFVIGGLLLMVRFFIFLLCVRIIVCYLNWCSGCWFLMIIGLKLRLNLELNEIFVVNCLFRLL